MTTNLFAIANVKQLRTEVVLEFYCLFFRTFWGVGVLNSAIFNSFHNRVEFGTILLGLRNFGGGVWTPQTPPSVGHWSQWPRGKRRGSPTARSLGLWVRIPPGAWMSVSCECYVLSGRRLCDELITRPEESYRLWCVVVCDLETSRMRRHWPTGRAVE